MAAAITYSPDIASDVIPYWARIHGNKAAEEVISLASVRPKIEVQRGPAPADQAISLREFLSPIMIGNSDQHISLTNSSVPALYEMRECIIPQLVTNNGDYVDLQSLQDHTFLSIIDICLLDQANWQQSIHGVRELNTEGNHDQKFICAIEPGRDAGLNFFPGICVEQEGQRRLVKFHGHHLDSPAMIIIPARMAAGIYDDMVSKGADGAETAKIFMKLILGGLGYEKTYRNVSHKYDADLETGHVHLVEVLQMRYEKEFNVENFQKDLKNFGKNSLIAFVLSTHKNGALESFLKETVIPAFRQAAGETTGSTSYAENEHKTSMAGYAQKKILEAAFAGVWSSLSEKNAKRVAEQMLPVLEKDPGVGLLKDLMLEEMRPPYRKKVPAKTATGVGSFVVEVPSCMIDGRATSSFTFAKGDVLSEGGRHIVDWAKAREVVKDALSLPDKPLADNDLVQRHFQLYPGLHPNTAKQVELIYTQRGVLSDEETRERSRLPELTEMPVVKISAKGAVQVATPTNRPLVKAEMPDGSEVIHPRHIIERLQNIDLRTIDDLQRRINEDARLRNLFMPNKQPVSESTFIESIPVYMISSQSQPSHPAVHGGGKGYRMDHCGGLRDPEL